MSESVNASMYIYRYVIVFNWFDHFSIHYFDFLYVLFLFKIILENNILKYCDFLRIIIGYMNDAHSKFT